MHLNKTAAWETNIVSQLQTRKKKKKEGEEGKGWNHQMLKVYMNKYLPWKLQVQNNITQMQF